MVKSGAIIQIICRLWSILSINKLINSRFDIVHYGLLNIGKIHVFVYVFRCHQPVVGNLFAKSVFKKSESFVAKPELGVSPFCFIVEEKPNGL